MKRLSLITLAILFCLNLLACTSGPEQTTPTGPMPIKRPPYTVIFMTGGGGKQADSDQVLALFNDQLQDFLPNTVLDFRVIPSGEYGERWQLAAAASEKIDIAWLGWMQTLQQEVNNGAYLQLDDVITAHAPALWKEFDDWVWDCGRIDGKLYSIPIGMGWSVEPNTIYVPAELAERHLDLDAYTKAQQDWETSGSLLPTNAMLDVLEQFLVSAKAAGDLGLGIAPSVIERMVVNWYSVPCGLKSMVPPAFTRQEDPKSNAVSILDEDMGPFIERMTRWNQAGFIYPDALWATDILPDRISDASFSSNAVSDRAEPVTTACRSMMNCRSSGCFDKYCRETNSLST